MVYMVSRSQRLSSQWDTLSRCPHRKWLQWIAGITGITFTVQIIWKQHGSWQIKTFQNRAGLQCCQLTKLRVPFQCTAPRLRHKVASGGPLHQRSFQLWTSFFRDSGRDMQYFDPNAHGWSIWSMLKLGAMHSYATDFRLRSIATTQLLGNCLASTELLCPEKLSARVS